MTWSACCWRRPPRPREHADGPEHHRRALSAVIAAAYRVVETWEEGDLAGRVTAFGAVARQWDAGARPARGGALGRAGHGGAFHDEMPDTARRRR